jgi:pimeloyl-ACP methyl ester carboxylesterase
MGTPQEDVMFEAADGARLSGWWVASPGARTVVLLGHGYSLNRSELAPVAWRLWTHGCACLLFDFRRHGRSGGKRTGFGYWERQDWAAAARFARDRMPDARIVLLGNSMGAAAAAFALAENSALADALILDSAYGKLTPAIQGFWRFFGGRWLEILLAPMPYLAWWMLGFNPFRVDVAKALEKVTTPVLLLHGDADVVATPEEARRNAAACGARIEWFAGCDHSEGRWRDPRRYESAVLGFLRDHEFVFAQPEDSEPKGARGESLPSGDRSS